MGFIFFKTINISIFERYSIHDNARQKLNLMMSIYQECVDILDIFFGVHAKFMCHSFLCLTYNVISGVLWESFFRVRPDVD